MYPLNDKRISDVIIQRQYKGISMFLKTIIFTGVIVEISLVKKYRMAYISFIRHFDNAILFHYSRKVNDYDI